MGGVDKPRLVIAGVSMLDRAITAMRDVGAAPIVVAGPRSGSAADSETAVPAAPAVPVDSAEPAASILPCDVRWVREDPPFTGPAAAVVAALAATAAGSAPEPEWTFVLACDLPRVDAAVRQLVDDILLLPSDTEGACLADEAGRPQWLTGVYRTSALRQAAASLSHEGRDQSMRALFADVAIASLADHSGGAHDIDTWEDFRRFTKEDA